MLPLPPWLRPCLWLVVCVHCVAETLPFYLVASRCVLLRSGRQRRLMRRRSRSRSRRMRGADRRHMRTVSGTGPATAAVGDALPLAAHRSLLLPLLLAAACCCWRFDLRGSTARHCEGALQDADSCRPLPYDPMRPASSPLPSGIPWAEYPSRFGALSLPPPDPRALTAVEWPGSAAGNEAVRPDATILCVWGRRSQSGRESPAAPLPAWSLVALRPPDTAHARGVLLPSALQTLHTRC